MSCDLCYKAVRHEGTPEGKFETLGGFEVYVAIPPSDVPYAKDKAVLFLPDVFGIQFANNQLLIDDMACNGFQTYGVDYFEGDPYPLQRADDPSFPFDREAWWTRHTPERVQMIIDTVIAELKKKGVTTFAATGYCFGGKYVVDLANANAIKVAVISHPGRIKVPEDFHQMAKTSQAAFLINSCEVDPAFPAESQKIADEIFGEGKYQPGYLRTYWEGCKHGFAVKGDMSDPKVKAGKEGSFKATIDFFRKL